MQHLTVQEVQGGVTSLKQARQVGEATNAVKHSPFISQLECSHSFTNLPGLLQAYHPSLYSLLPNQLLSLHC